MTIAATPDAQVTPQAPATPPATPPAPATPATPPVAAPATPSAPSTPTPAPTSAPVPDPAARVVPETYVFSVPEADRVFASDEDHAIFSDYAKREQMTQAEATAFMADQIAMRRSTSERLLAAAKADPEIGGDKFGATQQSVATVLDRFLPASEPHGARLRSDLTRLGLANYPPLAVLLARIGQAMAEDRPAGGGSGPGPSSGDTKPTEEVLWPKK